MDLLLQVSADTVRESSQKVDSMSQQLAKSKEAVSKERQAVTSLKREISSAKRAAKDVKARHTTLERTLKKLTVSHAQKLAAAQKQITQAQTAVDKVTPELGLAKRQLESRANASKANILKEPEAEKKSRMEEQKQHERDLRELKKELTHKVEEANSDADKLIESKTLATVSSLRGTRSGGGTRQFTSPKDIRDDLKRRSHAVRIAELRRQQKVAALKAENLALKKLAVAKTSKEKKRRNQVAYLRTGKEKVAVTKAKEKVASLTDENTFLHLENADLRANIEEFTSSDDVVTFEGGKYLDVVRQTYYDLLTQNVAAERIEPIIRTVLRRFTGRKMGNLPRKSLCREMYTECLGLAQMQLGEVLTDPTLKHATHSTDGTSKWQDKFNGGIQKTLEEGLEDIEKAVTTLHPGSAARKVVNKILVVTKTTMSDRCATVKKFNLENFVDIRIRALKETAGIGWEALTEDERTELSRVNDLYCGCHLGVAITDGAAFGVKVWEAIDMGVDTAEDLSKAMQGVNERADTPHNKRAEAGAVALDIRQTCKGLQKRGCEAAGVPERFSEHCRRQREAEGVQVVGDQLVHLKPFKGNRYLVLLDNAAGAIFHNNDVLSFLEPVQGAERSVWEIQHSGDSNKLLSAIRDGHKDRSKLAGCKALGLLGVAVSHPLMKAVKAERGHVLDMNPRYLEMREKFRTWSSDASKVVSGKERLFLDIPLSENSHLVALRNALHAFKSSDTEVQQILELIFCVLCGVVERLLPDHFDNGKFANPTEVLRQETSACPKHNDAAERDFATLDRRLREMPNASTRCLEGIIMFANNNTAEWLSQKTDGDQARHMKAARSLKHDIIATFKRRKMEMREAQNRDLAVKKSVEVARLSKLRAEQEALATSTRLWTTTREQVLAELNSISARIKAAGASGAAASNGAGEVEAAGAVGAAASNGAGEVE
eukprot:gene19228-22987_t